MYVATANQMKKIDRYLIEKENYTIESLVEIASEKLYEDLKIYRKPLLLVGPGNNGADALSLAKRFVQDGINVAVCLWYFDKANALVKKLYHEIEEDIQVVEDVGEDYDVIIDGIFGNGLDRPLKEELCYFLRQINVLDAKRVAIDIPTGINANRGLLQQDGFKADKTISFMCQKLCFLNTDLDFYLGTLVIKSFGIEKEAMKQVGVASTIDLFMIIALLHERKYDDHKGKNGKITHFTGSIHYVGASCLAAKASVFTGSGIVQVCSTMNVTSLVNHHCLEATTCNQSVEECSLTKQDAILFGCGKGNTQSTREELEYLICHYDKKMVIDADGLNVLSQDPSILKQKKGEIVLTPHLVEFQRLVGSYDDLEEAVEAFAKKYQVTLVVKGPNTLVYSDGKGYRNTTGNPGMAIGGMGDVLAGIITSFLGQGYSCLEASLLGVFIHGMCGDEIYKNEYCVLPSRLIEMIPNVLKQIEKMK